MMISVLLDTNIYDCLKVDVTTREGIRMLIEKGEIKIVVPRTVGEELSKSPFGGVPRFFPVELSGNTVGVVGIMCAGDSIGSGDIFRAHQGQSAKIGDAIVADAAAWKADWLVSEDDRLLRRIEPLNTRCESFKYKEFVAKIAGMYAEIQASSISNEVICLDVSAVSKLTCESDRKISVYIDNNVWDFLFERKLDLAAELPNSDFCICITHEAEFEIPPIPVEKSELKAFIDNTIAKCSIRTDSLFGFYDDAFSMNEQRFAGFDQGRWASSEEIDFIAQQRTPLNVRVTKKNHKTGLYKDEADIALAARSFHSIILSLDAKEGPINSAYKRGGRVVFLTDFDKFCLPLRDFIRRQDH